MTTTQPNRKATRSVDQNSVMSLSKRRPFSPSQPSQIPKVKVEVNQFVHPCQQLPLTLEPQTIKQFQEFTKLPENSKIRGSLELVDRAIFESLLGNADQGQSDRIERYHAEL
jgi:hypothetical protein